MEPEDEIAIDAGPMPLTRDAIRSIVFRAVDDAVNHVEGDIAPDRVKAQKYYDGQVELGYEDGRSRVVASRVRDVIRQIKPSLMRVFLSSTRFCEYIPRGPEDVAFAEQATEYVHWKFQDLGGYRILSDAFHDALLKKCGIVKTYWEEVDASQIYTFRNLTQEQYMALVLDPDVEVIEHSVMQEATEIMADGMDMMTPPQTSHDMKIMRRATKGELKCVTVPPEEFFIDRAARSVDDCYVCGHRTNMRRGDLIAMGYPEDIVSQLDAIGSELLREEEELARRGYPVDTDAQEDAADPSMLKIMVTEAYMRMDVDGTGTPVLHRFVLGGTKYELLDFEPADEIPFAVFEIDPEPHAFWGRSIADLVMDDQDAATAVLRSIMDNVQMTNNPRMAVVENRVNMDDVLNNEIGSVVRMVAPGMVQPLEIPFSAGQTLIALQYLDGQVETKTGVTRASAGLDPDALQSTTRAAVTATVQAAAAQVETMARNLAEGGMRRLFNLMLKLIVKNATGAELMRLNSRFQPVDPRVWNASMDVMVNVGLGTGREEERAAAFREIFGVQSQIFQAYGPDNGMVTMTNIRNTLADMAASSGIRNIDRYFAPMNPETEMMLAQQRMMAQQMQPQASDPNAAFLQAEGMKISARAQADMMKAQNDAMRYRMEDDRERDRMIQDAAIKAVELLGKYGLQLNEQQIRAQQQANNMVAP